MHNEYTFIKGGREVIEYKIVVEGLFMYRDNRSLLKSAEGFIADFHDSKHDFNKCYGVYRISVSFNEQTIYFADNSGMLRFFISENKVYTSLTEAKKSRMNCTPNYNAIIQFLTFGCVYTGETIVHSVDISNPNVFYRVIGGKIVAASKNLKSLEEYKTEKCSLASIISQAVSHIEGRIGCTITGGIDSRAVLANIVNFGIRPELSISGNTAQTDVIIAKEIADCLGIKLRITSDDIEEREWLADSLQAADGQFGICGIYRENKLAKALDEAGIELQFGGLNGEMYKNSFINQDYPWYWGKPNWTRFYKYKVGTFDYSRSIFGDRVQCELDSLQETIVKWLSNHKGRNKAEAYLNAGYSIMQARGSLMINMYQRHVTMYHPLMERKMASYAFGIDPYSLEMQAFQRHEVSESCKIIQDIKTDRNLTCNYKRRAKEFFASYLFLVKVGIQRIVLRAKEDVRIDKSFEKGLKNEAFLKAFNVTKKMGIISNECSPESIPPALADRLFTIGAFFESL